MNQQNLFKYAFSSSWIICLTDKTSGDFIIIIIFNNIIISITIIIIIITIIITFIIITSWRVRRCPWIFFKFWKKYWKKKFEIFFYFLAYKYVCPILLLLLSLGEKTNDWRFTSSQHSSAVCYSHVRNLPYSILS